MLMGGRKRRGCRLGRDGVVALEFAIIAPVLALMVVGAYDVAQSLFAWQQAVTAAEMIVNTANTLAQESQSNTTYANLTPNQATEAMAAIYAVMPWLRVNTYNANYSVTLSGIEFIASENVTTPTATANLAWTTTLSAAGLLALDSAVGAAAPGNNLQSNPRVCGTMTQVNVVPQSSATLTQVPTGNITTPGTIFAADVYYVYNPLFFKFITGPLTYWATAVSVPLAGGTYTAIDYDRANAPNSTYGTICTGYL